MLLNRVGRIGGALWGPMPPHFPRTPLCSVLHYIHNWHFQSLLLNFSLFWLFFEKQCQNWHSFTKKVGKTENFLKILGTYLILLKVNWTHSENGWLFRMFDIDSMYLSLQECYIPHLKALVSWFKYQKPFRQWNLAFYEGKL